MGYFFNVEELVKNPCVKKVSLRGMTLTTAFRVQLFQAWKASQNVEAIVQMLEENGITKELTSDTYALSIENSFKMGGIPFYTVSEIRIMTEYVEENPLILSGKYVQVNNGLRIDPDFKEEIFLAWPNLSIEDSLRRAGVDPVDVGYQRIQSLKREFEARTAGENDWRAPVCAQDSGDYGTGMSGSCGSDESWDNPYVHGNGGAAFLQNVFFNETYLLSKEPLDVLPETYGIRAEDLTGTVRTRAAAKLRMWRPTAEQVEWDRPQILEIQKKRMKLMNGAIEESFADMGRRLKDGDIVMRRKYCEWVHDLPRDPWGHYTTGRILEMSGMARSTYYKILSDDTYGSSVRRRAAQDEEDIALVRQVLSYRGFKKGIRQVYMMMPDITGQQFSLHRIRRLMNKYGIRTNIRRPSKNRKAMRDMFERNQKANLLMRRFKQHRPNEVRLTDVTYLDYGDGLRAYGSASLDPVTGKLACFVVSSTNDLRLALDTLKELDAEHLKSDVILHSDQGILYMTDEFQAAARDLGLAQSMSRRGNCWDNAPQESFFGHFKDECPYKECRTLEELRDKIDQYRVYYNEERRMWDRNRMTPAEFEAWLLTLDETGFARYLADEEARYQRRKEESARQAVERARAYKNMGKTEEMTDETCSEE